MSPQFDLLADLDPREARDVLALGSAISLAAGGTLFRLGTRANSLYAVQSGLVTLSMPLQVGGREEEVRIDELTPGQTLGWSTLIPPHRFTLNATAPVRSELVAFPRERLLHHFEARPAVGYVISRNIARLVGERMQVFQAMWLRQVQQMVNLDHV